MFGGDLMTSVAVIALVLLGLFIYSQLKFKDKLLCVMHTQNGMRLEMWLPLRARHVKFGNEKRGDAGIYYCLPRYFSNTWWTKGISRFFPALVPTIEFYWFSPMPVDTRAEQRYDPERDCPTCNHRGAVLPAVSWHTPEVRNAAWQENRMRGFARAAQAQASTRRMSPIERYLPLATFGILLFLILLLWRNGVLGV